MLLKEVINGNTKEYYINDKKVDEDTYKTLSSDDTVEFMQAPLPTETCFYNNGHGFGCECDDCLEIVNVIEALIDVDEKEAFEILLDYVDFVKEKTKMNVLLQTYEELGKNMLKMSGRIENELDEFLSGNGYYE